MENQKTLPVSQLDKARDFRFFALLASFVFFLDFALITFKNIPLTQLTYESIKSDFYFGEMLVFFILFAFLLSFIVPFIRHANRFLIFLLPSKFTQLFESDDFKYSNREDFVYIWRLEKFAVKNNNAVAYRYCKEKEEETDKTRQMEFFCLAFLVTSVLDFCAYTVNNEALFSALLPFFNSEQKPYFADALIAMSLYCLYIFCFYWGVVRGSSLIYRRTEDMVYFPDNEFIKDRSKNT